MPKPLGRSSPSLRGMRMGQTAGQEMSTKAHWEAVFKKKQANEVGWYQPHLRLSMQLISPAGVSPKSRVIDVGGGTWRG